MTTFDLAEVRDFTADIDARMDRCDNGEEMECTTEDIALRRYAEFCCELRDGLRRWGQAVFSGRVAFDSEVERDLLDAARRLYSRALLTRIHAAVSPKHSAITLAGKLLTKSMVTLHLRPPEKCLMAISLPDARELSDDILEALRLRALRGCELGFTETEVADLLGVSRETVCRWWTAYAAGGLDAIPRRPDQDALSVPVGRSTIKLATSSD